MTNEAILEALKKYKGFVMDKQMIEFLEVKKALYSNWKNNRCAINPSTIVEKIPEIRIAWIKYGEEPMLKSDYHPTIINNGGDNSAAAAGNVTISSNAGTADIESLKKENEMLKEQVRTLQNVINYLTK